MGCSRHGLRRKEDQHLCIRHRLERRCRRILGATHRSGHGLHSTTRVFTEHPRSKKASLSSAGT